MLCGVTATLGSNPSATATAARPHWGRAVLLCLRGVLCRCVAVWPHGCSGRRRDRPLCVPVGGGPPARRPRCELRSARRLEARPGPAAAHRHRGRSLRHPPHQRGWVADVCLCVVSKPNQAPPPPINFARNSPAACSNIEFASLELQRFWGVSKNDRDKLRAKFGRRWCRCCLWAPQPGPVGQMAWLSETAIAFAGADRASTETPVAFAGAIWAFLAQFWGAEVMPVSAVPYWGRAVVMVVSMSPRCCASCANKFARRSKNVPKWAFWGVLGEFLRGDAAGVVVVGELCRPLGLTGLRASRCLPDPR